MKNRIYSTIIALLLLSGNVKAQSESSETASRKYPVRKLTVQPGIGIHPYPFTDVIVSNLIQWNINKRLSMISHSAYIFNDVNMRNFNFIKTNYNYSLNQKIGIGTSFYGKHLSHSFFIAGGVKYDAFSQTLENPDYEKVTVSVHALSPDFGLLYNLKAGKKKYFYSFSIYIPAYPYPLKGLDINFTDSNLNNISVEMGVGIRIK